MELLEAPGPAPIEILAVAELLPQTDALKALLQQKREQERQQKQEEGERLQDEQMRALELRRQDEHLRRSKLQRKLLRDAREQQRKEEEGRSRQDPSFTALLRHRRVAPLGVAASTQEGDTSSCYSNTEEGGLPRFLALGALGLTPVQIRMFLREALAENGDVEELDMSRTLLTDDDGPGVCNTLRLLRNLRAVSLEGNHFGVSTAKALRKALEGNESLQSLTLGGCLLGGTQGLEEIFNALRSNKSLKHLSLRGMHIDQAGGDLLLECLYNNTTLESLDISDNFISAEQHRKLADLVAANRQHSGDMRARERFESALLAREEELSKELQMKEGALRLAVEVIESRRLTREAVTFAEWERKFTQDNQEHEAALAALQQSYDDRKVAAQKRKGGKKQKKK